MPYVFSDMTANDYDLTITTSADWTVSAGGMPNGDNYLTGDGSIAATYNVNGDDFDFRDGTAWAIECWVYFPGTIAVGEFIMCNGLNGFSGGNRAWMLSATTTSSVTLSLGNAAGGDYLAGGTSNLSTGAWHHVVFNKATGNSIAVYADTVNTSTATTISGTVVVPTSSYRLFLGTDSGGTLDMGTDSDKVRISKLAIWNRLLTSTEINDHYLAMTAA